MNTSFDGIILGTGHNALVLQAYLGRCGLETISLDSAAIAGGGLMTMDNPRVPGFRHNVHSFFHRGATAMPWYRDLDLHRNGPRYLEPELNVAMLLRDGRSLEWWTDLDRTVESCAAFCARDAAVLKAFAEEFKPIVENILLPEAQSPPLEPNLRRQLLSGSALGRRLLALSSLSPLEFVQRYFENDTVRAGLLFFNGLREVDLRLPGFGHTIPALLASRSKAQMAVGGSVSLARSLLSDISRHGGQVRCGIGLRRILVERGRAWGIELTTGERIEASGFIASGLNPQQTFLELLSPEAVPTELRRAAEGFQYNVLAPLFGLHLALDEPPLYTAASRRPELAGAFMVLIGLEGLDQFASMVDAHGRGSLPAPVAWGACPTLFDSSQAPAGKHTAFLWEKVPYALRGNPAEWAAERDIHGAALMRFWEEYAPNLQDGIVLDRFALSPVETEVRLPNMRGGDLLVGSFGSGQVGFHRPFAGAGTYRTAIPGLYLCGGSTHPGGNITGLCGYNAARVIASDLGKRIWWNPPNAEQILRGLQGAC